ISNSFAMVALLFLGLAEDVGRSRGPPGHVEMTDVRRRGRSRLEEPGLNLYAGISSPSSWLGLASTSLRKDGAGPFRCAAGIVRATRQRHSAEREEAPATPASAFLSGGRGSLALAAPARSGFARNQNSIADVEGGRHLVAKLVKQLHADAMPPAKFFDRVGVDVV